jgi:hypothetical protein
MLMGVARLGCVLALLGVVEHHWLCVAFDLDRLEGSEGEVRVALARDLVRLKG